MISAQLVALLRCPVCGGQVQAAQAAAAPACLGCGAPFQRGDGYLVAPPPASVAGRDTHYQQAEFAEQLDFRSVGRPWLGAAVRLHWLRRWLVTGHVSPVLEIGCGDGRFLVWNARRGHLVGLDAAPLFSQQALAGVDLVQGDGRALPFADGSFAAAYSIDVLEHLDAAGLAQVMAEARRVVRPGGHLFVFTNSREPSTFQPIIRFQRWLSGRLRQRGMGDFATDDLRKADHVKALATFEDFVALATAQGFAVRRHRFWNGLAQGFIDNVLIRAGEHVLIQRRQRGGAAQSEPPSRATNQLSAGKRQTVSDRPLVRAALWVLTGLMQLDVIVLGRLRSGPFFALLERQ